MIPRSPKTTRSGEQYSGASALGSATRGRRRSRAAETPGMPLEFSLLVAGSTSYRVCESAKAA